jgi:hypothetical protein
VKNTVSHTLRTARRPLALLPVLLFSLAVGARESTPALPQAVLEAGDGIRAAELEAHLRFLASDELKGRGVGHYGNEVAAVYLAEAFRRIGLQPVEGNSYFQPFDLYATRLGTRSELTVQDVITGAEGLVRVGVGDDFYPLPATAARTVAAGLVFAGYGISAPDLRYDDYAGLDVTGRIVAVLEGTPAAPRFDAAARARAGTTAAKSEAARGGGAVGLIVIQERMGDPARLWPETPSVRAARYRLAEVHDPATLPMGAISARLADRILAAGGAGTPVSVAELRRAAADALGRANGGRVAAPASFPLRDRRMTLAVDLEHRLLPSRNVIGFIEGSDPLVRNQLIVVGAHLDHDGLDGEGRTYNGADDNGSGMVSVLEIAEAFADAGRAGGGPRRTVVFALWNAEERGLLGARYFLRAPRPEAARVVAKINLDMVGRSEDVPDPASPRFRGLERTTAEENRNVVHLLGYSYAPGLARLAEVENGAIGLTIRTEYDDHPQNLIRRSDHWPFLQQRIPAIFFTTGLHPDYHTPDDRVEKIEFDKMERIARLVYRVAWRAADLDEAPTYVDPARPATLP